MTHEQEGKLFEHCTFAFVLNRDLPRTLAADIQSTLESQGGTVLPIGEPVDITTATHIISETSDFPKYSEARLHMIPVVTPAWITQSLLKNKEAQIRGYTPDPNLIFSNITLSCANIPTSDKDAIIGAVLAMGGMEQSNVTKLTTHICALTMDHPKCQVAVEKSLKCKIVLPHWFDDCLKLGKRIDERPYLLPDPEIFRKNPEDAVDMPQADGVRGASTARPDAIPLPTDTPSRRLKVFKDKRVMISEDLGIGSRLRKILEDLIEGGGGSITNSVHNADIYVCHWRDGRDYVFASRAGIDVGNLSWLYHLITHNEWTSPLRRLLHYPLPRDGIPEFKDLKITLSNYGGEARTYLENLVIAAGAEFTKSMKQENTHLITARNTSEKCAAAKEWGVEMVNHLWIEESYAKCQAQKISDPRYMHFPPRTNLGEIIGQTQFDADILERIYFPKEPTPSPSDPRPLRRRVMHEKDRNAPSTRTVDGDVVMGGHNEETAEIKEPVKISALPRPRSKSTSLAQVRTPSTNRRISAGKENNTPSSTGSRSAKDKAASRIHSLGPDMALYEKEKKRKGHVWGGERAANQIDKQRTLERSSSPAGKHEKEEFSDDEETHTPKRHKSGLPPVEIRLLITGYKGWLNNVSKEDQDKKKLRELGVLVTQNPTDCTHLAAPAMVRTQKFLCALANGPTIVSSEFIDTCIKTGEIPNVDDFLLKDKENEKKFGLKLKDTVVRAKANKKNLLRRVPIYCTKDIPNGSDTYKAIVEVNGGTFAVYTGRPTIKKTKPEEDEGPAEPVYLITGLKPAERQLWPKFTEMAEQGNMIPRIVTTEWLLDVAMSQQHKWDNKYLAENDR